MSDPQLASIVHLSADRAAILREWTITALGLPAASVQGVAWQPVPAGGGRGRLWFALVGYGAYGVAIADDWTAGSPSLLPGSAGTNGLA